MPAVEPSLKCLLECGVLDPELLDVARQALSGNTAGTSAVSTVVVSGPSDLVSTVVGTVDVSGPSDGNPSSLSLVAGTPAPQFSRPSAITVVAEVHASDVIIESPTVAAKSCLTESVGDAPIVTSTKPAAKVSKARYTNISDHDFIYAVSPGATKSDLIASEETAGLYVDTASGLRTDSVPAEVVRRTEERVSLVLSRGAVASAIVGGGTPPRTRADAIAVSPVVVIEDAVEDLDDASLSGRGTRPASCAASSPRPSVSSLTGTSSATTRHGHKVSFAPDDEDFMEDLADDFGEAAKPDSELLSKLDYRQLIYLIFRHYPESKSGKFAKPKSAFKFESLFDSDEEKTEEPVPVLLLALNDRLAELRDEIEAKARTLGYKKKFFPPRRGWNRVPGDIGLSGPPKLNDDFADLQAYQLGEDVTIGLALKDLLRMESTLQALLESLSFTSWVISTVFSVLKEEGYKPRNPRLFKKLMKSYSVHAVEQARFCFWLSHACVSARKERYLATLLPSVAERHKKRLFCESSPFADVLFDPKILSKVKDSLAESVSLGFQLSVSEMVTMSVADKGKSGKGRGRSKSKTPSSSASGAASSDTSSTPSTASPAVASQKVQQAKQALSSALSSKGRGAAKRSRSRSRSRSPASSRRGKGRGKGFQ